VCGNLSFCSIFGVFSRAAKFYRVNFHLKKAIPYFFSIFLLAVAVGVYWHFNVIKPAIIPAHHTNLDAYNLYVPFYAYTAECLRNLDLPLWNPYQLCGVTYLGVLQGAVFYPPVLLFAFISPAQAYSFYVMLHMVLGGLFLILLMRHLKVSWIGSVAAAVTFIFCSSTVSNIFGPAFLANSVYFPLMLLFVLKVFETGRVKWALALTAAVLLPLLAGWIQALVYCVYALLAFVIAIVIRSLFAGASETRYIRRGLILLAVSACLFFVLAAVQILPVMELGLQSTRSFDQMSEEMVTIRNTAIYGPYRIVYDLVNSRGGILPFFLYVGVFPLLFALLALGNRKLRFFVLFFYGLAGCAVLLSMGPQTPLHALSLSLPLMKMFRAPFRFLFLYAFSAAILCGIGLDVLLARVRSLDAVRARRAILGATATVVFFAVLLAVWPAEETGGESLRNVLFAASRWPLYLLAFSVAILIFLVLPINDRLRRYAVGATSLLLILIDLFAANHNYFYLPEKNPELFGRHDRVIEKLKTLMDIDNCRVFVAADFLDFSYNIKAGQLKKISMVTDYENMNPTLYNRYCNYIFGRQDQRSREFFWGWFNLDEKPVHPEFLDYMSARYIWVSRSYAEDGSQAVKENVLSIAGGNVVYADEENLVFLNERAMPRAYIVGGIREADSEEHLLEVLASDEFSPSEEVAVLRGAVAATSGGAMASAGSKAVIVSMEPEEVRITAYADGAGYLVLTDQYYPGWEATVDGRRVDIFRANFLFRGIPLEAGEHEVVFRYRPKSFMIGAGVSTAGIAALIAWAVCGRARSRISFRRRLKESPREGVAAASR